MVSPKFVAKIAKSNRRSFDSVWPKYGQTPLLMNGWLGFVVSHPFARKKANGWGTGALEVRRREFIAERKPVPQRVGLLKMTVQL